LNDELSPPEGEAEPMPQPSTESARGSSVRAQSPWTDRGASSPDMHAVGSRIGGYMLRECIGQGGMARVYRAEHEGLQRQVALKVLLDAPGGVRDGHERFLREARIAAAIKHRNVVNIFDVGVDRGTPYLAMELLEGADLDTFMGGRNRLDEATTMDIIVPIASALATVHDAGIIHRDLKPGNIFLARGLNDELEPRLLDFGISKSVTDQLKLTSAHGPVLGTPFYMSPEAATGGEMTALSDQYALGVVLYECLTGVHPFAASSNFAEIVQRITIGDYTPITLQNPQLSRRMASIVERAMQLEPGRRFADMRALGRELLLLAGQRTRITWQLSFSEFPERAALVKSSVLETTPLPMVRRKSRRNPSLLLSTLITVGTLALLVGAWSTGRLDPLRDRLEPLRSRTEAWVAQVWQGLGSSDGVSVARATVDASGTLPVRRLALEPTRERTEPPPSESMGTLLATADGDGDLALGSIQSLSDRGLLPGVDGSSPAAMAEGESAAAASSQTALAVSQALRGAARPRATTARRSAKASYKAPLPGANDSPIVFGTNHSPILD
jgi:serine/threonine protein kinase